MPADPGAPPPSGPSESEQNVPSAKRSQPAERYGIVSITRHVKEDGRALLLYTREGREGP
jgi:hypothetical protein